MLESAKNTDKWINKLVRADCMNLLDRLETESIDLIVTDPPYGLHFLGKDWDKTLPNKKVWEECFRVLKAGSFAFVMSAPRMDLQYRMALNLEEAGFDIGFTPIYWAYSCISDDTEILTETGFKSIEELSKQDMVATFNIVRNKIQYQVPEEIMKYNYSGELINIKNQNTDQLLTPNHRVYCKNKRHSGNKIWWEEEWSVYQAKELVSNIKSALRLPLVAELIDGRYNREITYNIFYAELLGIVLTDGGFDDRLKTRTKAVRIYQSSVNKDKVLRIRFLLNKINANFKEYKRKRMYNGRIYTEHTFYFNDRWAERMREDIPNRKPTYKLLKLKKRYLQALLNGLMLGDGCWSVNNESGVFYQKDSSTCDWFQILCLHLGYRSSVNEKKDSVNFCKANSTEIQSKKRIRSVRVKNTRVWCVRTKNETFVARRNGKIFITGNSGFPKAMNIGKAIDKRAGVKRKIIGKYMHPDGHVRESAKVDMGFVQEYVKKHTGTYDTKKIVDRVSITAPATPDAKRLDGSYAGFQPKPAVEVIIVAMKPLSEDSFVDQALWNIKGITWLDDCRIPVVASKEPRKRWEQPSGNRIYKSSKGGFLKQTKGNRNSTITDYYNRGRFPANLLVSNDVLNDGTITKSSSGGIRKATPSSFFGQYLSEKDSVKQEIHDEGSFSRYYDLDLWFKEKFKTIPKKKLELYPFALYPKASTSEKERGLENFTPETTDNPFTKNSHPTVKPVKLMAYLVTLGSREGDIVLDPYIGSGTTAVACKMLKRNYIGCDINKEWLRIAIHRLKAVKKSFDLKELIE